VKLGQNLGSLSDEGVEFVLGLVTALLGIINLLNQVRVGLDFGLDFAPEASGFVLEEERLCNALGEPTGLGNGGLRDHL
jgi:hypothetical protein